MYTDPIADYLTRVRNAQMARHKVVEIPASSIKKEITKILEDKGYIYWPDESMPKFFPLTSLGFGIWKSQLHLKD